MMEVESNFSFFIHQLVFLARYYKYHHHLLLNHLRHLHHYHTRVIINHYSYHNFCASLHIYLGVYLHIFYFHYLKMPFWGEVFYSKSNNPTLSLGFRLINWESDYENYLYLIWKCSYSQVECLILERLIFWAEFSTFDFIFLVLECYSAYSSDSIIEYFSIFVHIIVDL